ncbi:MAG TPA: alkaline phosphatase family protein [Acidobacteriaceae bacterium]|nr:alkaline phosphatase family protein [Acidobacteriaceae bacterium]
MRSLSVPRFLSRVGLLFLFGSAIAFPVLTSGCGSSSGTKAVPQPTVTISASPASVTAGASATLTVTATNAGSVKIAGSDGSSYSLAVSGGTQSVTPTATVTYTATAAAVTGPTTATATATVTVTAAAAPTVTISANPTTIGSGTSSTLTVAAANATTVTISGSDGSSYTLTSATGGTQAVSPAATTIYTATATGPGGTVTAQATVTVTAVGAAPTVTITANPTTIAPGGSSTLTVTAVNATQVTVTGTDNSSYTLSPTGGTQAVSPAATTTYTATATGAGGTVTAAVVVTVTTGNENEITHVIFMLQENHTFDNYFGMLNPYRESNGWNIGADGNTYNVDGIDDKLSTITNEDDQGDVYPLFKFTTTCIDDETSAWLASYGQVDRYNFTTGRGINMDGFVHNAEGFTTACNKPGATCSGTFNDTTGRRSMGYYDQGFLNYYYYMASQFALSDRWFSPVSSKSVSNRLAAFTGGTTQGLVKDPSQDDDIKTQLAIPTIFQELDQNNVSWKLYYTSTQGFCFAEEECTGGANANFPATWFTYFSYSYRYLYLNPSGAPCTGTTQSSTAVGDTSGSFCIDTSKIAPLTTYYTDVQNGTLPSFAFIESGSGLNDEHPGSTQSILKGQAEVAKVIDALMSSPSWPSSAFFMSYDEGGGPYEHVPPVPGHSNDYTDAAVKGLYPDISSIAVNADSYNPCLNTNPSGQPTLLHCDLATGDPGTNPADAPAVSGFAAQLGFRLPNMVISPFTRKHYVSHIPMDHTAVIKFVENRFIGSSAHLTNRDAAQPSLLDFFDFTGIPWSTPPTPPAPNTTTGTCNPDNMGP